MRTSLGLRKLFEAIHQLIAAHDCIRKFAFKEHGIDVNRVEAGFDVLQ